MTSKKASHNPPSPSLLSFGCKKVDSPLELDLYSSAVELTLIPRLFEDVEVVAAVGSLHCGACGCEAEALSVRGFVDDVGELFRQEAISKTRVRVSRQQLAIRVGTEEFRSVCPEFRHEARALMR